MAIDAISWVLNHSRSRHGARLVLVAVANCMNSPNSWAWPSNRELQRQTNLAERAVRIGVAELIDLGELAVEVGTGPGGCNRYRVLMSMVAPPAENAGGQKMPGAEIAGGQDLPPSESVQLNGHTPAGSAPPALFDPRQKTPPPPAESAPGTVMNRNSTSTSKESLSVGAEKPPARKRGSGNAVTATRIPGDFAIDDDMRQWAKEKIPGFDIDAETENFIDYWRQRADKGALKADWVATWRTWMRRAAKDAPAPLRPSSISSSRQPGGGKKTNYTDEEYASGW